MKNFFIYTTLILFFSGCDVLDVEPTNSIPAATAFKTKADVEKGIFGAYNSFQLLSYYGRTYNIFSDLASDNLVHPPNATATAYREVDNNAILPENESIDGIWSAIYDGINVANNVIAKVPSMAVLNEDEKNRALGELYFIRALMHFNLLNYFGPIPLKTAPTVGLADVNAGRESVENVTAHIINDLTFASDNLPGSGPKYRASAHAANALLARVYLYQKNYPKAIEYASRVIDQGGFTLLANFADIFASDGSAETIFEIDFTPLDRNRIAEYNFPLTQNGRGEVAPSPELIAAFEAGDERLAASIAYSGITPYAIKYDDLATGGDNVIVLRLGEMYLIRAEALALSGGEGSAIRADINTIRTRANLVPTTESVTDALIRIIEKERRLELAFEGHRWFDLVRTGRAMDVLPNVTNINKTLFPIPQSELITNTNANMYQNPGY